VQCFQEYLRDNRVRIFRECPVKDVLVRDDRVTGIRSAKGVDGCDRVIVATGGLSYPRTGSSGDGYRIARALGHTVTPLIPALVPLEVGETGIKELQGISLKSVALTLFKEKKRICRSCGGIVFTHYGLSGPAALELGKPAAQHAGDEDLSVRLDLVPSLSAAELEIGLVSALRDRRGARVRTALRAFVPDRLARFLMRTARINETRACSSVSREERKALLNVLSRLEFTRIKTRPIEEAMVTSGGISLREIDPRTMGSRLVKGLYFCGEVIDIDGDSGGYNLQAAFSTGYTAGESAAQVK
jgi:predicted Rossmann fold flavoprotein